MMHSSTVETQSGSGSTATSGTGASRRYAASLFRPARLVRAAARLTGLVLPFAGRRAARTGLRALGAWAAALVAGLALTLAATDAWAQSCTTNAAPTVNSSSAPITNKLVCEELEDCTTLALPPNVAKSTTFTGTFSDPGDTLTYSAALEGSSAGWMSALKVQPVTRTVGDPGEEEEVLQIRAKPREELLDLTPAVPNPLDFVVKITATDGCNSAHVYSKQQTLWRYVDSLSIVSRGPYSTGDTIQVRVNFAQTMHSVLTDTDDDKKHRLRIDLGGSSGLRWAVYKGANVANVKQLTFEYTVTATDNSAAGVAVVRNSLEPGKGFAAIRPTGTTSLNKDQLIHVGLAPDRRHRVGSGGVAVTPSPGALVSNVVTTGNGVTSAEMKQDSAQQFTTGGDTGGYRLTRVDLALSSSGSRPDFSVSIYEADGTNPDLTKKLGTLRPPVSVATGSNTFTAPGGIDLAANTNYFVVVDVTGAPGHQVHRMFSSIVTGEDAGKAAGWSIANVLRVGPHNTNAWANAGAPAKALLMAIHGYVKGATVRYLREDLDGWARSRRRRSTSDDGTGPRPGPAGTDR